MHFMKSQVRFFALILFIALGTLSAAPGSARAVEIEQVTSDKGIKAWLVHDPSVDVIAMEFTFRGAGAVMDPQGKRGTANMVASLIDEGAGERDSKAVRSILEADSITMRFNAGLEDLHGSFYSLNRYRDEGISLLHDALTAPRFDKEPVERIRRQIISNLVQEQSDPDTVASNALMSGLFGSQAYGMPSDGDQKAVVSISTDDLRAHVKNAFGRDNLIIGVTGNITADELKPILDRVFGDLPAHSKAMKPGKEEAAFDGGTVVKSLDVPQSSVVFAQAGPARRDKDFYALYILNHIMGGSGLNSLLSGEIREKRGLVYTVTSYLHPLTGAPLLAGYLGTKNASVKEAVGLVRKVWKDVRDNGVTSAELEDAKTFLTGSYPLRFTNSSSIASMLAAIQEDGLGIDYINRRNDIISSVTLDQVNAAAGKWLKPDALTFAIAGKPEGMAASPAN